MNRQITFDDLRNPSSVLECIIRDLFNKYIDCLSSDDISITQDRLNLIFKFKDKTTLINLEPFVEEKDIKSFYIQGETIVLEKFSGEKLGISLVDYVREYETKTSLTPIPNGFAYLSEDNTETKVTFDTSGSYLYIKVDDQIVKSIFLGGGGLGQDFIKSLDFLSFVGNQLNLTFTQGNGIADTISVDMEELVPEWVSNITEGDINTWNNAIQPGDNISQLINDAGYLSSFTELDPTVPAHVKAITTTQVSNWNSAYSWGDHSLENYLRSGDNISELANDVGYITASDIPALDFVPLSRVLTLNPNSGIQIGTTSYDLSANRTWNIGIDPAYTGFTNYYTITQVDSLLSQYLKKTDLTASFNSGTGILNIFDQNVSLDGRYSLLGHTHAIADIVGLQSALNSKEDVFTKGDLTVDSNMTISGTGKLVGGDLSIGVDMTKFYTRTQLQTSGQASVHWGNLTNIPALVLESRAINTGTGLTGGGNLSSDRTLEFDVTWGDARYLRSFTELDPTVPAWVKAITALQISNWNTAFSWGNHATEGYIKIGDNISDLVNDVGYITSFDNDYISSVSLSGDDLIFVGSGGAFNGTISLAALHHSAVSIGTANGLSINASTQVLSLALASTSAAGAMSAADKTKLDGLSNYSHPTQAAISVTATGVEVMSVVAVNTLGHVTSFTKRTLPTANGTTIGVLSAADWTTFNNKQTALVSGTNIKTINGVSLLGSGNLVVGGVNIKNAAGVSQWVTSDVNPDIRFEGAGDTSISYNASTRTVIINSIPGSGTGGAVTSFNGRVGGVTSQTGDYNISMMGDVDLTNLAGNHVLVYNGSTNKWHTVLFALTTSIVTEGTRLYFTDARARAAVSLTTTGNSGAATYNNSTGVFNIPNYTLAGLGGQPLNSILTSIASLPTNQTGRIKLTNGVASLETTVYLTTETDPIFTASAASGITSTNITNWNALVGHNHTLDSLSNVTIGTKATGNLLQWNGTAWVNVTPASLGFTSNTGTVTSIVAGNGLVNGTITTTGSIVLGTPSAITLSSTNSVTAQSHTHAFTPGGTAAQYITGAGALATFPTSMAPTAGSGNYIQNQNVSAQSANAWISGTFRAGSTILAGYGTASDAYVYVGAGRSADGSSVVDFFTDATANTTYNARIHRLPGVNSAFSIEQRGTGTMYLTTSQAANIIFRTNGTDRMMVATNGDVLIGSTTNSGLAKFQVTGAIQQTSVTGDKILKASTNGVLVAATNADLVALLGTGNYVTTNTSQTGLSGNKQWTAYHTWYLPNYVTDYTDTPNGITFLKSFNAANGPSATSYFTGIQFSSNNDTAYKHQLVVNTSDQWYVGRNGANWTRVITTSWFTGTTAQYVAGNGTFRTSSGDFILNQNSSAQTGNFWVSGESSVGGDLYVGRDSNSNSVRLDLGYGRSVDGNAIIRFYSSVSGLNAQIHRGSGEHGNFAFNNVGNGDFLLGSTGTGSIVFRRINDIHFQMFPSNNFRIGGGSDNGFAKLQVAGNIGQSVTNALIKADGNGTLVAAVASDITSLMGSGSFVTVGGDQTSIGGIKSWSSIHTFNSGINIGTSSAVTTSIYLGNYNKSFGQGNYFLISNANLEGSSGTTRYLTLSTYNIANTHISSIWTNTTHARLRIGSTNYNLATEDWVSTNHIQNQMSSAQNATFWIANSGLSGNNFHAGYKAADSTVRGFKIGYERVVDGNTDIQFFTNAAASTTRTAEIIAHAGANGAFQIINYGTGTFELRNANAANLDLLTNASLSMRLLGSSNIVLIGGLTAATGTANLQVSGSIRQTTVINSLLKTDGSGNLVAATSSDITSLIGSGAYVTLATDQLTEITGRKNFNNRFSVGFYNASHTVHTTYSKFGVQQTNGLNVDVAQTGFGYNTSFLFGAYLDSSYASTDLFTIGNLKNSGNGNEYGWRPGAFTFVGNGGTFQWRIGASPAQGTGINVAVASWSTLMQLGASGLSVNSLASAATTLVVSNTTGLLQSKTNGTTGQYLRGDLTWRNSTDDFILNQETSAQANARFWVSGNGGVGGNFYVGRYATATNVFALFGINRTVDGGVFLDMASSVTNAISYDFRIERQAGVNGTTILRHKGTGAFYMSAENAGPLIFRTDAAERMRITPTTGLILMGLTTNTGSATLQVSGTIRQTTVVSSILKADGNGNIVNAVPGVDYAAISGSGNYIQNQFASAQSANAWISGSIRALGGIDAGYGQTGDALMGIGRGRTTDGNSYIDLFSTAASNTAYSLRIIRSTGVNGSAVISHRGTGTFTIQTEGAAALQLNTSNTSRALITSAGQFLIGTTSNTGNYKLQVETGTDAGTGLRVRGTIQTTSIAVGSIVKVGTGGVLQAATGAELVSLIGTGTYVTMATNQTTGLTGNKTWNGVHQFLGTNTTFGATVSTPTGFKVYINSGTQTGSGLYVYGRIITSDDAEATSDRRKKKEIKQLNISDINFNNLNSYTYKWEGLKDSPLRTGFIAQEWQHIPGVTSEDDMGYLTIRPTAIMAVMFEKVKELNNTIYSLKQEIKELKDAAAIR